MNGADVLLYVEVGASLTILGSQTGMSIDETTDEIDVSSKDSRAGRYIPGRYGSTLTCDALFEDDDSVYGALSAAMRNGTLITARVYYDGVAQEEADCIVTKVTRDAPDQAPATLSVDLRVDGEWVSLVS